MSIRNVQFQNFFIIKRLRRIFQSHFSADYVSKSIGDNFFKIQLRFSNE